MTYFLHRITHEGEVSWPLLQRSVLTIGFSDISNRDFLDKTLRPGTRLRDLDEDMRNAFGGNLLRSRHGLWRFLRKMNSPSQVLVPTPGNFSIYRVVDDGPMSISDLPNADLAGLTTSQSQPQPVQRGHDGFLYVNGCRIDLGFFRKVELKAGPLSRNEYADRALTARMKALQVNLDISDLENSIAAALRAEAPLSLRFRIMAQMPKDLSGLIYDTLNTDKFESLIRWYLQRVGASEVYIPPRNKRDIKGDADVVAIFGPLRTIVYVQAKFFKPNSKASDWAVRQITEYVADESIQEDDGYARVLWVVSTCGKFSEKCRQKAKEHNVILINGQEFAHMLIEAGISGLDV